MPPPRLCPILPLLIVLLLAGPPAGAFATAAPPQPEHWGERYAAALLRESPAEQLATVQAIFADAALRQPGAERLLGQLQRIQRDLAPDEFHHAELMTSNPSPGVTRRVLHVYVRRQGDTVWRDIQMLLDPAPPHRIASIVFVAEVAEPVALPAGDLEQPFTREWLDGYIDKLVRENDLAGSLLVVRGEQVLFERQYGFADAARTRRIDAGTLFNLGSGNKMFTALVVAQLAEAGALRLDDPLVRFLPDLAADAALGGVTLRHLLNHTSGVAEYWRPDTEAERLRAADWHDLLPLVRRLGSDFPPGTRARYSNSNFLLLGAAIEKVTGRDYFDVVAERIYRPAGMATAGSFGPAATDRPLAVPLRRAPGGQGWQEATRVARGSPAGGGYATPADLVRFARALRRGVLVSPATLRRMTADAHAGLADGFPYGEGFEPGRHGRLESFGHGGIAPGVNFEFRHFPSLDVTLVMFSNQDNGAYDDLRRNVTKLISGER